MRTKLVSSTIRDVSGYGDYDDDDDESGGTVEECRYECPCGEGAIVESHDNIPGFSESECFIQCATCSEDWVINKDAGIRRWELEKKK